MAKNVNQNPNAKASINYRDFDMSQHIEFTSTVAQLLPVYYDVLNPGDKIRASQYIKTRTQPLASAAMAKLTEHIEWFFVPMEQIYKPFSNFYYGVQDFNSSNFNPDMNISTHFPFMRFTDFCYYNSNFQANLNFKTLMGEQYYTQLVRLATHLGFPSRVFTSLPNDQLPPSFSFTPLFFCAYQKIFMDYFRDGDRIANDPYSYNLDRFYTAESGMDDVFDIDIADQTGLKGMFEMRYRPIKKDFYTNIFPSPIFNNASASAQNWNDNNPLLKVNQWLTGLTQLEARSSSGSSSGLVDDSTTTVLDQSNDSPTVAHALERYALNQANIRTLFAADKLLELTRRAGKHYDSQTLAHFGVYVPDTLSGECFKLGHSQNDIIIGDVVSTAGTEGTPLGEIGGKGYSASGSDQVEFTAPCHGVLMAIYSCVPEMDYYQDGLDKLNTLIERSDYFIPEYDNLGMQPLFGYQTQLFNGANDDQEPAVRNAEIKGWQYRYMELKQKVNRIFGGLQYNQKHWTVGRDSSKVAGSEADKYYHDPAALNSVVEYQYLKGYDETGAVYMTPEGIFERDPLIHEIFFDVKKASKMSTYGLMDI